ncbi:tetratricopeptide repeat protein [Occallatibacter riparius]|uniref:Tetratricopeptide repeat protein n=1 Tax=Occallatibacter riparius TaxID=1002689 RepID=A0A9J7BSB1_9BACT|nr:tetratricopeptide repeat protein [Occallatibacter riparius]UWZ85763.1 tetratricopeptide repeat protein [Occallatibacter riparius]
MKQLVFVALVLFAARLPLVAQSPEPGISVGDTTAQRWTFEDAQALAGKGRLDQAMNILNQLAAQTPESAGVERLRGMIFYQRDLLPQASDAFSKAISQDANDRQSTEMQGVTLFRLGKPQDAIPYLEKAHASVQTANVDPQYVLGLAYSDVGRYDDARHAFAVQYGFQPDSAEAYLLAARLFLRRELKEQAATQAQKALEVNPKLPLAHQLLGEAALARGDQENAIKELEAERAINPLNGELYDRLGDAYLRSGQYENAQQALNRAVLLTPTSTGPYILLGETFLKLKDPIQALRYLTRAVKMDPSNYITHNLLGQAYKATGQIAEANREFKTVVELQHRDDPKPAGK